MPPQSQSQLLKWRLSLSVLLHMVLLLLFLTLDMRDLLYKIRRVGTFDAFASVTTGVVTLHETIATPSHPRHIEPKKNGSNVIIPLGEYVDMVRSSGWTSFMEMCDGLQPFGELFIIDVMLHNCSMYTNDPLVAPAPVIPQMIIGADIRVDSMAWAACGLLYAHRQPPICQQPMVINFLRRDKFDPTPVNSVDALATFNSLGERRTFVALGPDQQQCSNHQMVCFEGFEYDETAGTADPTKVYSSTIFGCASPNKFAVAFAGYHAKGFAALQYDKLGFRAYG